MQGVVGSDPLSGCRPSSGSGTSNPSSLVALYRLDGARGGDRSVRRIRAGVALFGGHTRETYGVPVEVQEGIRHGVRKGNIDTDTPGSA